MAIDVTTFEQALKLRKEREEPEILIIEDQKFSRDLLKGMLGKYYKVASRQSQSRPRLG